jgi:hypothetical protein
METMRDPSHSCECARGAAAVSLLQWCENRSLPDKILCGPVMQMPKPSNYSARLLPDETVKQYRTAQVMSQRIESNIRVWLRADEPMLPG